MIRRPLGLSAKKENVSKKSEDVRKFISSWNKEFPLDFWWRQQHNTSFNSSLHRASNLIDVLIEVEEFLLLNSSIESRKKKNKDTSETILAGRWLKKEPIKKDEGRDDLNFDNIDISKF